MRTNPFDQSESQSLRAAVALETSSSWKTRLDEEQMANAQASQTSILMCYLQFHKSFSEPIRTLQPVRSKEWGFQNFYEREAQKWQSDGRGVNTRTLALALHLKSQLIFVSPPAFVWRRYHGGGGGGRLKLTKMTGIVLKLCLHSKCTLFALNVCHRSIQTAMFSVQCSLRMLLFTLCLT